MNAHHDCIGNRPHGWLLRSLFAAIGCVTLAVPALSQGAPTVQQSGVQLRVVTGLGLTLLHLPSFTYTRNGAREVEPEQDGGGLAMHAGVELLRGRFLGGARFQLVNDFMSENGWSANVGSVYAGAERRRTRSLMSAAIGATIVSREQVTRTDHWCLDNCGTGAEGGGTLTSSGLLAMVSMERRFGAIAGAGLEGYAASGQQRYAGLILRVTFGQSPTQPIPRSPSTHSRNARNNSTRSASW